MPFVVLADSSLTLRESLLAEHALTRTRRVLHAFKFGCDVSRQQKVALRALAGTSATRVMQMHLLAWRELVDTRKFLDTKSGAFLSRLINQQLATVPPSPHLPFFW